MTFSPEVTAINVLDKGYVRLVNAMGDDLTIVRAARVSYNAVWRTGEDAGKDEKLLRFLIANGHTSPFEQVEFQFEIKLPIFVVRQWHRHRTWSYNEISARYTEMKDEFYLPTPDTIGQQSKKNKQQRDVDMEMSSSEYAQREAECHMYRVACERSIDIYERLLAGGWPRELARCCLPVSMYTMMFAKVDLHNLLSFIKKRTHSGAQWEIQQYAHALKQLITPHVPVTMALWEEEYGHA